METFVVECTAHLAIWVHIGIQTRPQKNNNKLTLAEYMLGCPVASTHLLSCTLRCYVPVEHQSLAPGGSTLMLTLANFQDNSV